MSTVKFSAFEKALTQERSLGMASSAIWSSKCLARLRTVTGPDVDPDQREGAAFEFRTGGKFT